MKMRYSATWWLVIPTQTHTSDKSIDVSLPCFQAVSNAKPSVSGRGRLPHTILPGQWYIHHVCNMYVSCIASCLKHVASCRPHSSACPFVTQGTDRGWPILSHPAGSPWRKCAELSPTARRPEASASQRPVLSHPAESSWRKCAAAEPSVLPRGLTRGGRSFPTLQAPHGASMLTCHPGSP